MKIAIIGSGIAGLTAAWSLRRSNLHVTLLEKQSDIGMQSHAARIDDASTPLRGDVPSRMFNQKQWSSLYDLYQQVGVEAVEVNATQSLSRMGGPTFLNLDTAYRPDWTPTKLLNSNIRKIIRDVRRLRSQATRDLQKGIVDQPTLSAYLKHNRYSDEFIYDFLYPTLSSTVCTCSYRSLEQYPAKIIFETLAKIADRQPLLRTSYGTADVVARLLNDVDDIRLQTQVKSVRSTLSGVEVTYSQNGRGVSETFQHVVIATQANQALRILAEPTSEERTALQCFTYETIPVIVHRDSRLMPVERNNWATFNILVRGRQASMCSVWMNRFHNEWQTNQNIFQSINPMIEPIPAKTIARVSLQRPVVNSKSFEGWSNLDALHSQPNRRIWFCGSYASYGLPLLETGVVSGRDIAERCRSMCLLAS